MTRRARLVVPGLPHHVTQWGNRREAIFFEDGDQEIYRDLLETLKARVEVWAYCLMPNPVHFIVTPETSEGLGRAIGEAHRRYTNFINARGRWTGHLFQSRFASVAMDEAHLMAAVRYVSLNPVRARMAARTAIGILSTYFFSTNAFNYMYQNLFMGNNSANWNKVNSKLLSHMNSATLPQLPKPFGFTI